MVLAATRETEIEALAARYGAPRRVVADLTDASFDPLIKTDRIGEVCMVVRRRNGRLITAVKTFYPYGAYRLLTGGVAPGEGIEAALLREVDEETGLTVAVRRFLAVIEYRAATSAEHGLFATFAFLVDEIGGVLAPQDPGERLGGFREVLPEELPALAEALEQVGDIHSDDIVGRWRSWGIFRAVVHRVVYAVLCDDGER